VGGADSVWAQIKAKVKPDAIQLLRRFMMDERQYNDLLDGDLELQDEDYALSLLSAADFANMIPPGTIIASPGKGLPLPIMLNLGGTMALEQMINRRLRNELAGSDAQVSVDLTKSDKFSKWCNSQRDYYRKLLMEYKMFVNLNRGSTILPSAYFYDFLVA
jgi:hypothetical protein